MAQPAVWQNAMKTIRVDGAQIERLLTQLDGTGDGPQSSRRRAPRYRYRAASIGVRFLQTGMGHQHTILAVPRNISEQGISFLHGGFVHLKTRCQVRLVTSFGSHNEISGTVVRCRYVEANIHEVALLFDHEINPAVYCTEAVQTAVLLVTDNEPMLSFAKRQFERLNAEVKTARDGAAAMSELEAALYDIICIDAETVNTDPLDAARQIRASGYPVMLVAATAKPDDEQGRLLREAGCEQIIRKPYSRDDLARLVDAVRKKSLFSKMHDEPMLRDLIRAFISKFPERIRGLAAAARGGDPPGLENLARVLRIESLSYGFDVISEAAGKLERALQSGRPVPELQAEVHALARLCMQARTASATPTDAAGEV